MVYEPIISANLESDPVSCIFFSWVLESICQIAQNSAVQKNLFVSNLRAPPLARVKGAL